MPGSHGNHDNPARAELMLPDPPWDDIYSARAKRAVARAELMLPDRPWDDIYSARAKRAVARAEFLSSRHAVGRWWPAMG
ncbi:hypothetical protein BN12_930019 [Nostocoides japonicum T1-X7]|uniref:Uncharacterized protein n=1 Tax=Nostocoides japonicum T1-X7 TaxID=1194083 RepID=A0A077M3P2_9MICO|nr:hypothetical protein BN12_930019 [Tetrasphaera japonica T1-X7]